MTTPAHSGRMLFVDIPVGGPRGAAGLAARGSEADGAEDYGFMYSRSFFDLDGHGWQVMWMDPAAVQQSPEAFAGLHAGRRSPRLILNQYRGSDMNPGPALTPRETLGRSAFRDTVPQQREAIMAISEQQLMEFFDSYAQGANSFDPETIRSGAADVRLGVTPTSVSVLTWADDYRERIAARRRWLLDHGYKSASITSRGTFTIDALHTLANTTWTALYDRSDCDEVGIEFHVSYLLRQESDGLKVLVYISHEDEEELLSRHGLLEP